MTHTPIVPAVRRYKVVPAIFTKSVAMTQVVEHSENNVRKFYAESWTQASDIEKVTPIDIRSSQSSGLRSLLEQSGCTQIEEVDGKVFFTATRESNWKFITAAKEQLGEFLVDTQEAD